MPLSRRHVLTGTAALLATSATKAETRPAPPSVLSNPPRTWGKNAPIPYIPDPDILTLDPSFKDLLYPNAALTLITDRFKWVEGPTWSSEGRFLLISDPAASIQYQYLWESGEIVPFRSQTYNANGNTIDTQGRILTCEEGMRRVIRWELDGSCTVLADQFDNQHLNSPNDIIVHPDTSIWFTDPAYGDNIDEGHPDEPGGRTNPDGRYRWRLGEEITPQFGGTKRQPDHVFKIDPTGKLQAALTQEQTPGPNGLCFSPDHKTLYVISTSPEPGQQGPAGDRKIRAFDIISGTPTNGRIFADMTLEGQTLLPDGMRADIFGNIWAGARGPLGLCGVFIYNPTGKMIGRIRLPMGCQNLTFGGPKRNTLFMGCAGSLFSLELDNQGAGIS